MQESSSPPDSPALRIVGGALGYGDRVLWRGLNLDVESGEFLAVLGSNGSGKTSLLRAILGLQPLLEGTVEVAGHRVRRGDDRIGYVPQQRRIDSATPLRARDLVRQGLDGHRWGPGWGRRGVARRISVALEQVDAAEYANVPVGMLSGGEQQRLRVAEALACDPELLLCDEPLSSLDLSSQQTITELVDRRRQTAGTAVVFVTHEINPVLPYVDRVLYLANGQFRIGSVDEVMTSSTLSELYHSSVDVIRAKDRILVVGVPDTEEQVVHHADPHERRQGTHA